jgi:D-alanine-D-alanine ligase
MLFTADPPAWFSASVLRGETLFDQVGIVLVANIKDRTKPTDDYEGDSIITEFLSETELDDLVEYFEGAGFYCEVLIDEEGFLEWLSEGRSHFPRRHPLVYNLAQNGTGPARLTLVAGLCRLYRLPLIDSDAHAVAIANHKFHAASLLSGFGFPVAHCWLFTQRGWWPKAPPSGLRVIAKPTYESASIGIHDDNVFTMVESSHEHLRSYAAKYRQPLTVQEFIVGSEVEVPVLESNGPQTLAAIGIELDGRREMADRILTYDQVFNDRYSFYNLADVDASAANRVMGIARQAFRALGMSGMGRVDFRIGLDAKPHIMEVNCKPHITKHSAFNRALNLVRCSGTDLARFLVGSAAERYTLTD